MFPETASFGFFRFSVSYTSATDQMLCKETKLQNFILLGSIVKYLT